MSMEVDGQDLSWPRERSYGDTVRIIGETTVLALCILLFIVVATDVLQRLLGAGGALGPIKLLLLVPMLLVAFQYHRHFFAGVFAAPELSLLLALCVLSATWSLDTFNTVERSLPLIATTVFSMTIGSMLSLRGLVLFLGTLCLVMILTNFAAIATLADARGAPPWENTWRGVHNHKNGLGGAAMISVMLMASTAMVTKGRLQLIFGVGAVLSLVLLVASESRTSQILTILALVSMTIAFSFRRYLTLWTILVVLLAVSFVLVSYVMLATGLSDPIFELLERKTTLSGRIPLWQLVWPAVLDRPWLGYGYVSFWDPEARRVVEIARDPTLRFTPFYSHNGLIETLLNVGVVGVLLFVGAVIRIFASIVSTLQRTPGNILIVPFVVYTVTFLLYNVTESSILSRDNFMWMIFVMVATKLSRTGRTVRREAAFHRGLRRGEIRAPTPDQSGT